MAGTVSRKIATLSATTVSAKATCDLPVADVLSIALLRQTSGRRVVGLYYIELARKIASSNISRLID